MNFFIENKIKKDTLEMDDWRRKKEASYKLNDNLKIDRDICYLDDGKKYHKIDVYYSDDGVKDKPVIFSFHGGGLLLCDKSINKWVSNDLVQKGYVVFCIDYPLVPDADINGILIDAYKGVRKSLSLVKKYNGSLDKIYMCGDSAGGFIATYLTAMQNNSSIRDAVGIDRVDFSIKGLILISPMLYTTRIDTTGIFTLRKLYYGDNYRENPIYKFANPECMTITLALPKTIFVTAKNDYLRHYTIDYCKHLENNGIEYTLYDYDTKYLEHDFVTLYPEYEESKDFINKLEKFINS